MSTLTVLADIGGRGVIVGFLLPLAIVALVAYGTFELIRSREVAPTAAGGTATGWTPAPAAPSSALTILDERFARGELDAEEYVQRRSLLAPPAAPTWTSEPTAATPASDVVERTDAPVDPSTTEQPAATAVEPTTEQTDS